MDTIYLQVYQKVGVKTSRISNLMVDKKDYPTEKA